MARLIEMGDALPASLTVKVGDVLTLDIKLQVGAVSSVVEVQAAAGAELQTTTAAPGTTIAGPSLLALPNLGRDANPGHFMRSSRRD